LGESKIVADFDQQAHLGAPGPRRHRQQENDRDENHREAGAASAS
jgi:hypothetical protein